MRDNAPIGNTCKTINYIIDMLDDALYESQDIQKHTDNSDIEASIYVIIENIIKIKNDMENIRNDNSTLREWGNELYLEKEKLEDEIDYLKNELHNTTHELNQVQYELDQQYINK